MASSWNSLSLGAKIRRGHTLLWWALVFPSVVIVMGYTAISSTLHAQSILKDHSIVQATVALDEVTPPTRQLARFKYSFEVDGKTYSKNFPVPQYRADDVEIGSTIAVAYANFDPDQSQREELLAGNADLKANLTSALTLSALGAVLIGFFWLFFSFFINRRTAMLD
ncbi:MAG TPA: hypothetical protein VFN25_14570 [Dokdonella sp.]|uniref:hypothetical protein n=1 Tax=Dokdonella sp. TaxID=2291710 RepID=UPI002D7EE6AE|nr:hypothetical protein [Dokdonella sp.]HET9034114.1 hypothetical protein [Dokdonella sp.]